MFKRFYLSISFIVILTLLLTACGSSPATTTTAATTGSTTQSQSGQTTAPTTATAGTSVMPTTQQTTVSTTKPSASVFEKLDVLKSYSIVMTMEALAGSSAGIVQKYEAKHLPQEKTYDVIRLMAQKGKDFVFAEEQIMIGDSKWYKTSTKDWVVGNSSTAAGHITELTLIYTGLAGKLEKIDEPTVSGIPTIHYSYLYEKLGSLRLNGEVWIANQSGLAKVPIKAFGEQAGIDDKGATVEDYRHVKFAFEVSGINADLKIKPPM